MSRTALVILALLVCVVGCWVALSGVERGTPALAGGESESPTPQRATSELAEPELVPATTEDGADASAEEIIAHCRQLLAGFKLPKAVFFGELPKTSTGKIQKFELRARVKSSSAIDQEPGKK